jgi:tetratricopeptide (TPR) repeat protein
LGGLYWRQESAKGSAPTAASFVGLLGGSITVTSESKSSAEQSEHRSVACEPPQTDADAAVGENAVPPGNSAWRALLLRACLLELEERGCCERLSELAPLLLADLADPTSRATIELAWAEALLAEGYQARALACYERALEATQGMSGEVEALELRIRALDELTAWEEPRRAEALRSQLASEIDAFFQAADSKDDRAWVWLAVSRLSSEQGHFEEASKAAMQALAKSVSARVRDAARVQQVICLRRAERHLDAERAAREGLAEVAVARCRAELLVQLGHTLYDGRRLDEAEQAYCDALSVAKSDGYLSGDQDLLGSIEAWRAHVECDRGDLKAAEVRALSLSDNARGDGESYIEALLVLGRVAIEREQYDLARSLFTDGLAREAGRTYLAAPLQDGMARAYYLEGLKAYDDDRAEDAIAPLRLAIAAADSSSRIYAWAQLALAYCFECLHKPVVARAHHEAVSKASGATPENLASAYEFLLRNARSSGCT